MMWSNQIHGNTKYAILWDTLHDEMQYNGRKTTQYIIYNALQQHIYNAMGSTFAEAARS